MKKYLSRKFLICVAAFLGSTGTSIAGIRSDNPVISALGVVCATVSAAIYAACEAYVDAADLGGDIESVVISKDQIQEEVEDDG